MIVPFGRGRLILLGTNMDPADEKLDEAFFERIYHYKSGKGGAAREFAETMRARAWSVLTCQ